MNDQGPERGQGPPSLNAALRTARAESAERSQSLTDLRGAEIGRLDLLREALDPVLAQVPADVDLFDTGIVPGEHPRLFVDMIAFVDMARDRRTYRFHLDTRHGRVLLAETDGLAVMTRAVTDYIARRLVEREKALASAQPQAPLDPIRFDPREGSGPPADPPAPPPRPVERRKGWTPILRIGFEGLGLVALACWVWFGLRHIQGLPAW